MWWRLKFLICIWPKPPPTTPNSHWVSWFHSSIDLRHITAHTVPWKTMTLINVENWADYRFINTEIHDWRTFVLCISKRLAFIQSLQICQCSICNTPLIYIKCIIQKFSLTRMMQSISNLYGLPCGFIRSCTIIRKMDYWHILWWHS